MSKVIEVSNLNKNFGAKRVLQNLNFDLDSGQSIVMLGLNGAGKTTTISILLGLLKPSSGLVKVMGVKPGEASKKEFVSCLPQASTFPAQLKVKEVIDFMKAHYSSSNDSVVEVFNLQEILNTPLKNLSGGQKRRVSLACAFVGSPKLVFLDEPTAGVDISQKKIIWNYLSDFQKQGGSLFLTTHDLMEAEILAQNLIFLHNGKIVEKGTKQDLKKKFSLKMIKFKTSLKSVTVLNSEYLSQAGVVEASVYNEVEFLSDLINNFHKHISDITINEMSLMEVIDCIDEGGL